ncbi:uncharacterized protein [Drosophila bipectinata]|uniref:uncharacterized protein n=1 Tax=Drosophila bipectinata TaxID=42026 RepID=UPI001C8AFC00|nr:uncharacterized protein LOC108130468 [Drosophila bipectinata]
MEAKINKVFEAFRVTEKTIKLEKMEIPSELVPLLSCGLCRRRYNFSAGVVPKELACQHNFCGNCLMQNQFGANLECQECKCPLCGIHTQLEKVLEPVHIMFLLREMPALLLGRAILGFSSGRGDTQVNEVEALIPGDGDSNWLAGIDIKKFLGTYNEPCMLHGMPSTIWCHNCKRLLCRDCTEGLLHFGHRLTRQMDYTLLLRQLFDIELGKIKVLATKADEYAVRDMSLMRQVVEACNHVQLHTKRVMLDHKPSLMACQMRGWIAHTEDINRPTGHIRENDMVQLIYKLYEQRQRYNSLLVEIHLQCRMRAAIQENGMKVLEFEDINQRLLKLRSWTRPGPIPHNVDPPPALILTNYCVWAYWHELQQNMLPPLCRIPSPLPERLPQSLRAVIPPNFNPQRRDIKVFEPLPNMDMMQDPVMQTLQRCFARYENYSDRSGSVGSSGSASSRSSHSSNPAAQLFEQNYNRLSLELQVLQRPPQPQMQPQAEMPPQRHQHWEPSQPNMAGRLNRQLELQIQNYYARQQQQSPTNQRLCDLRIHQNPGYRALLEQQEQLEEDRIQKQKHQLSNLGPPKETKFQQHIPQYQNLSAQSAPNTYYAMVKEEYFHRSNERRNSNTTNNNDRNTNYTREKREPKQEPDQDPEDKSRSEPRTLVSIIRLPSIHCYPIYYMELETAGKMAGNVLIEVRPDAAPRMAENFGALIRHDFGFGYRGCAIFQAWADESVISGDFETNHGRGGHSAFVERYFMPEDTGLLAYRGTIGIRRGQKRQDNGGYVGSQFRLVLREMRLFTAIFGYIIEGIEVVEKIAASGDAMGRPAVKTVIRNCGEYTAHRNSSKL